eukprot:CAMPEP_0171578408 /NCGR_PEP_ID=MMETSP0961-20121227/7825_1 /TAXON_ID=87120 /ORGANISM="Aurantiochytrium limacinum, Strain ATCCMYA-1381" /LENGTH=431 /DNA_ID=CAMNT_0012134689 /DNA_START=108 /DNA_END=1403 /DNA_ORIENTATION=+
MDASALATLGEPLQSESAIHLNVQKIINTLDTIDATCKETSKISEVDQDPCYSPALRTEIRRCNCRSSMLEANSVTYMIDVKTPQFSSVERVSLDEETIADRLMISFIHINKAGGSTIKKDVIFPSLAEHKWDGAGLGTFRGWQSLGNPWNSRRTLSYMNSINATAGDEKGMTIEEQGLGGRRSLVSGHDTSGFGGNEFFGDGGSEPLYIRCGKLQPNPKNSFEAENRESGCPLRAIWGSMTMGLCDHFPGRPCSYLVILRDPLERAISNYNYVCIQGAEGRKKWRPDWRKQGFCPLDIREFFEVGLGEPNFLLWRLTRGCDTGCGAQAAIKNLAHPCTRFLLLEELQDGLLHLEQELGSAYGTALRTVRETHATANAAKYGARIETQLANETLMEYLRERLKDDIIIYEAAKKLYKEQWNQPLQSCNSFM